jgi:hypothetical protein
MRSNKIYPTACGVARQPGLIPNPSVSSSRKFLAVLDDERGFIVNTVWLADLAKVFILR